MNRLSAFLRMLITDPANPGFGSKPGSSSKAGSGSNSGSGSGSNSGWGVNPATLLPMEDGFTDVGGNAMGIGLNGSVGAFNYDTGMNPDDYYVEDNSCWSEPIGHDCGSVSFECHNTFDD